MKMTRLEWQYLQRIALDHPYFDTHKLPLTEKEAKAIVEANIKMTGKEFVDSIYAKLGMTRPEEKKDRFAWLRNIGELFTVPPIRKIAIAVLVVVLMTVFFTATPTGRAIAESLLQYIATLFEDGDVVFNRNDNEITMNLLEDAPGFAKIEMQEQENNIVYVNTFEEFTMVMDVQPTVLPFTHTTLYYDYDESIDCLMLYAEYETPKGVITTYQIWNALDLASSASTGFTAYDTDPSIFYSIEEDGTMFVTKSYEDSIIEIYSDDSFTVDELISFLMNE